MQIHSLAIGLMLVPLSSLLLAQGKNDPPKRPEPGVTVADGSPGHLAEPTGGTGRPVAIVTGTPNSWFDKTRLSMGTVFGKKSLTGRFNFRNPTGQTVRLSELRSTCQCGQAKIVIGDERFEVTQKPEPDSLYRVVAKAETAGEQPQPQRTRVRHIDVPAGAAGYVEVRMDVDGLQGPRSASLAMASTDPKMKHVDLVWAATGVKRFAVTPPDIALGKVRWNEQRKFSFTVASAVHPDFELRPPASLPAYVKVTRRERTGLPGGQKGWIVEGTFGPDAQASVGGAAITFGTDQPGQEVGVRITATIAEPLVVTPGAFLSFGRIKRSEGKKLEITLTPDDDFALELVGAEFTRLSVDREHISATGKRVGKSLVVTVAIAPNAKGSVLLRGALALVLNHPAVGRREFNFNGVLR